MRTTRHKSSSRPAPSREVAELRARLAEAEETLRAIRTGEVDTVVVTGKRGPQVFTLEGAEQAYRMLIERMNEGALTLTAGKMILYANQCFARMVKCPLEQVIGSSLRLFLSAEDGAKLRPLLKRADRSGSKIQVLLNACDGSQVPAQISIRPLAKKGLTRATIGMVVTDMTEARRSEEMLRALSRRLVQTQETERRRVALELHDNIVQLLAAVIIRFHTLAKNPPSRERAWRSEVMKLRALVGRTVEEVERISRKLRPGVLEALGLVSALRATRSDFVERTGVALKLTCVGLAARLPADTELTLYRIFQEALTNVGKHARARHVTVFLRRQDALVQLVINDDGIGFKTDHRPARRKVKGGVGLLGMRERAEYAGGALRIKSAPRAGTRIEVRIPLPPGVPAVD